MVRDKERKVTQAGYFSHKPQSVKDTVIIVALAILVFAISAAFDVFDNVISWVYRHDTWELDELFTVSVFMVFAVGIYARRRHKELLDQIRLREEAEAEKKRLIPELDSAREDLRRLRSLMPICSSCKKIRDDKGYWNQVELYIEEELNTKVVQGLCPDCAKEFALRK